MPQASISRRVFLAATTAAGLATLTGCGLRPWRSSTRTSDGGVPVDSRSPFRAYRFSTRGKRASNAARSHAANMLFVSSEAADARRAHPGDQSAIVSIDISRVAWTKYFGDGSTEFDLRAAKVAAERAAECAKWLDEFNARVNGRTLVIETLAGADGKLFGSVTPLMVSNALQVQLGISVDRKSITLPQDIKTTGSYTVQISLPCGLTADVKLDVVAKQN